MSDQKTIQTAFRIPSETLEWVDQYTEFLTRENGFPVSRAQAFLRLISLAKPQEELRMGACKVDGGGIADESSSAWERIASAREMAKTSQGELGALIGKTKLTIGRWERGTHPIPDLAWDALARALGVRVEWLRYGHGKRA